MQGFGRFIKDGDVIALFLDAERYAGYMMREFLHYSQSELDELAREDPVTYLHERNYAVMSWMVRMPPRAKKDGEDMNIFKENQDAVYCRPGDPEMLRLVQENPEFRSIIPKR